VFVVDYLWNSFLHEKKNYWPQILVSGKIVGTFWDNFWDKDFGK
jgi:hypothetical protein